LGIAINMGFEYSVVSPTAGLRSSQFNRKRNLSKLNEVSYEGMEYMRFLDTFSSQVTPAAQPDLRGFWDMVSDDGARR
jgi:hypothetical protein